MTDREALHALVDALPEESLPVVASTLRGLSVDGVLPAHTEARIRRGIADAERGAVTPAAEVFRGMHARLDVIETGRR
jgi:hypothetical protein